jgi:molecular chaperone GrpE
MVKKKNSETEKIKEEKRTETTENKDNVNKQPADKENPEELLPSEESKMESSEAEASPEDVSDKVIPEEDSFEAKLAEMQDKYLRLSAEFDNYRKRTLKEKMEMSRYAGEELLKKLLPIMDDFERAFKSAEASPDCNAVKAGIDLIYCKLSDFLKQEGVKEIESLNKDFNVDLHDAVAKIPVTEEDKKDKIVEVISKGYYLKDKVLRHARVVIGE